jgi:hypothetical protein
MADQEYPFPHCNSEVLHAPGMCKYCDMFPDRQAMRSASRTPFTPYSSNGWPGNVAVPPVYEPRNEISDRFEPR